MKVSVLLALAWCTGTAAIMAQEAPTGDAAAGEEVYNMCRGCHAVGEGATNRAGPVLNDVFGRVAGALEGFRYSNAMVEAGADGLTWTHETLDEFLADPRGYVPGTRMSFGGVKDDTDRADLIAYLATFSPDYVPEDAAAPGENAEAPAEGAETPASQ
jgi:cytochrome c2